MNDHPRRHFWYVFVVLFVFVLSGCAGSKETVKSPEDVAREKAFGPTQITRISSQTTEGKVRVTIESLGDLNYTVFTLSNPLRLVLDLPNSSLPAYKEPIPVNQGAVIQIVPFELPDGNRKSSRIEIELSKQARYEVLTGRNVLYVEVEDGGEEVVQQLPEPAQMAPPEEKPSTMEVMPSESMPAETKPMTPVAPAPPAVKVSKIRGVEVSQLEKDTRIIIRSDTLPEYEMKKETDPPRITLDLKRSDIATEAQKITDVRLVPSAVKRISSFQLRRSPDGTENLVRVIINLTQAMEPQIKTERSNILVDIPHPTQPAEVLPPGQIEGVEEELLEAPPTELPTTQVPTIRTPQTVEEAKYRGQPITLDFKDADLRDVLRIIAEINNFNLVLHPEVTGRVTVRLVDVPWDQALDIILRLNNLSAEIEGNIMRIGSSTSFQREIEAKRLEQEQRIAALETQRRSEPLRTEIITLNFADPSQILTVIEGVISGRREGQQAAPRRGTITVDSRTKTLIIQDTDENIRLIRELVARLDKRTPQILIEARIVTVNKRFSKELGINWSGESNVDPARGNTTGFRFPNSINTDFAVNLPLPDPVGTVGIQLGSIDDVFSLDLTLVAAETEGRATILSQPKVVTVDNKPATIQTGITFTVPVTILVDNTTQTTIQEINATLSLNVTPRVSADGHILMSVNVQNNSPNFAVPITTAGGVPPINTQTITTEVLVRDGDTVVLGGILQTNTNRVFTAVPYLHKIPILGRVFRSTIPNTKQQDELLIFITPRLLNAATVEQQEGGSIRQLSVVQ